MTIAELLSSKAVKQKQKTELLSKWLLEKQISVSDLLDFAKTANDTAKAACIEVLELATRQHPNIADKKSFQFVTQALTEKAPSVKWESAKVIGNTAHLFTDKLDNAIKNLLQNTEHAGTVVRWSAAYALGEIVQLKTKHNKDLVPVIETICSREKKDSIKKIYLAAIKNLRAD